MPTAPARAGRNRRDMPEKSKTAGEEPLDTQVQKAVRDLESRTLAKIPGDIAKMVFAPPAITIPDAITMTD
jgi:hypothetical protein